MKKLITMLLFPINLYALIIPKSSLESVKSEITNLLASAKKSNNADLIKKYQNELSSIDKKIKHFELEWLQYRKRQLNLKPSSIKISSDINEIDNLIKQRS